MDTKRRMKKYHYSYILIMGLSSIMFADSVDDENLPSSISKVKLNQSIVSATKVEKALKELDRNVYLITKDEITNKGFTSTEEIFRFSPFITTNNTGLGTNIDMRGQGNKANTSLKVLLNGNDLNMLDSSHGVTPFATIAPSDIESIEILPGGGAVVYGNGTRGGAYKHYDKQAI